MAGSGPGFVTDVPGIYVYDITPPRGSSPSIELDTSDDLYHITVRAFGAAVRSEGQPTATRDDGLQALKVALGVEESLKIGKTLNLNDLG